MQHPLMTRLTDRENADYPVNGHADDTLAFILTARPGGTNDLHADIDGRLLPKPYDLRPRTPVPADERLIGTSGDEVLRRERDRTDAVEMAGKLLQRGEGE